MDIKTKKEKLAAIREELQYGIAPIGYVKNIGSVFFSCYGGACVLRDVVYYGSIRHGIEFEVLAMDSSYFVGSKAHAEALKTAFGGKAYATEYCHMASNPRELWAWEGPLRDDQLHRYASPLDYEEAVAALF